MRSISKVLLSTCAVCTIAHAGAAQAQPNQSATPSSPNQTDQTVQVDQTVHVDQANQTDTGSYDNTPPSAGTTTPGKFSYAWTDDRLRSKIGISAILGGGVAGFTDKMVRDRLSSMGGLWDLRVAIGSHIPLALELGYQGSATNLKGLQDQKGTTLIKGGTLVGTTAEAALRFNIMPHFAWNPYVFAGVGWQRFDVMETDVKLSLHGMNDHDNLVVFPMGAGVSYRSNGFVVDLRGTMRAASDQNLVLKTASRSPTSGDFAPMHTWGASAAVGYEF
jgi:hypothetical protein